MNEIQTVGSDLISKAIESGTSPEALQKLLDMQLQWQSNEARKSFKDAMVQFQAEKPEIKKTAMAYNSKYAPLPKIQKLVDPVLSMFGLSYRWEQELQEDGAIKVICIVSHVAGHEERTWLIAPKDSSGSKNPVQQLGSTVSYLKRYTLEGALGLSSDVDDDGGTPEKQELTPDHEKWESARKALKDKTTTIEAILKVYNLSDENKKLLKK